MRHGFSGRAGGTSRGPFASLNLSYGVGDDEACVRENRLRFAAAVGTGTSLVASAWQVHGADVLDVDLGHEGAWESGATIGKADGLLTRAAGVTLVATSADCVLVAIVDPRRGVVGIAHCGWRGTFGGLAATIVREAVRRHHVDPSDVVATVAPSIGPCCFEVGDEVIDAGRQRIPDFDRFVHSGPRRSHVDLWAMNCAQLQAEGVRPGAIDVAGACTRCRRDEFFSFRGGDGRTGIAAFAVGFAP
ncbi:MAG: laccase domain-containing protein [Planctomycetes bacterium]|nr:laccase domain-containing protein [Planctomycetota bacterium]MBI3845821.1 laccase domain-containing protein [Planctomycetota bacterium]